MTKMTFSEEKEQFINSVIEFIEDVVRSKKEIILLDEEAESFQEKISNMPNILTTDKSGVFFIKYGITKITHDPLENYGVVLLGYEMTGEDLNEELFELGDLDSDNLCLLADLIKEKYS